jgi:hypothetical protein
MHHHTFRITTNAIGALLCACAAALAMGQPGNAAGQGELELEGTNWLASETHRRVSVTTDGATEIKEGKDIYVRFLEKVDAIYVIEVRWWNESQGINVLEHGVLTRVSPNIYRYIEADHYDFGLPNTDFPGIIGRGTFELRGKNHAELIQIGHLVDGSASGFTTILERAEELPEVPVPQTYP